MDEKKVNEDFQLARMREFIAGHKKEQETIALAHYIRLMQRLTGKKTPRIYRDNEPL